MAQNQAIRYFEVPEDIDGIRFDEGKPVPTPFAIFFLQFMVPRIPNKTEAQTKVLIELLEMFRECAAGQKWELHPPQWQAMNDSLPPVQSGPPQKGEVPGVPLDVYIKTQPFYLSVHAAPTKKPTDWDDTNDEAPAEEQSQDQETAE